MSFDGKTYEPNYDKKRLESQLVRVSSLMSDNKWRTLFEIYSVVGGSTASISARLRDLRKIKFGGKIVERRARGERSYGIFEYRLKNE